MTEISLEKLKEQSSFLLRQMEQCREIMIDAEPREAKQLRREYKMLSDAWLELDRIIDERRTPATPSP